ncbi:MAG: ABC transporter ATP-binding protein [Streptosporangiaceae bacterium]|nr:ABC transporter ATP-binding protein [Streptosporangiaceae bacterium]
MTDVIFCQDLVKRYAGRDRNAVDGVTFAVAPGEALGVLGPNGAGKTTLIKMICGVTPPTAGQVALFGQPPSSARARRELAAVHQATPFDMMLSVRDNLRVAAGFRGLRWRDARDHVDRLLAAFDLADHAGHLAFTLSGGQHRRLQVVRALIRVPGLLVLDEPSSGMDVVGRRQVWQLLSEIRAEHGTATMWTSHNIDELERNCDRVMMLDHGRVLQSGSPQTLIGRFGQQILRLSPQRADQCAAIVAVAARFGFTGHCDAGTACLSRSAPRAAGGSAPANGRSSAGEILPDLLAALRGEQIAVRAVEIERASLEDVFVTLTSGGQRPWADAERSLG